MPWTDNTKPDSALRLKVLPKKMIPAQQLNKELSKEQKMGSEFLALQTQLTRFKVIQLIQLVGSYTKFSKWKIKKK